MLWALKKKKKEEIQVSADKQPRIGKVKSWASRYLSMMRFEAAHRKMRDTRKEVLSACYLPCLLRIGVLFL